VKQGVLFMQSTQVVIPQPDNLATNSAIPLVTVLMGVYNTATHLREAIDSILNQTLTDFEFLIYNDGSTDNTADIVRSYTDPRIVFFDNPVNRSVSPNMNEGIDRARGRYIIRMDGDDIAHPERIAKQVAYMEAHPEVGLCGSAVRYIGASEAIVPVPMDNDTIRYTMWLQNSFYQPSVIIRTKVLLDHNLRYDVAYECAEDYKLWADMCWVTQVHNLSDILLDYRIHPHQISRRRSLGQQQVSARIRKEQMDRLNIRLKPEQERAFELLTVGELQSFTPIEYEQVATLLEDFGAQAQQSAVPVQTVYQVLGQHWVRILEAARQYRPALIPFVLRSPLRSYIAPTRLLKLLTKCLISWQVK
jgi:glycosyltransferase involved in cell wall biosynthesis